MSLSAASSVLLPRHFLAFGSAIFIPPRSFFIHAATRARESNSLSRPLLTYSGTCLSASFAASAFMSSTKSRLAPSPTSNPPASASRRASASIRPER